MKYSFWAVLCLLLVGSCQSELPTERYYQYEIGFKKVIHPDSASIFLSNTLNCPIRISMRTTDSLLNSSFSELSPLLLEPKQDTQLHFVPEKGQRWDTTQKVRYSSVFGDPSRPIQKKALTLPYLVGKTYKIVQGYNGKFSHTSPYSRYAIDFGLPVGDTICAADSGFVVGLIKDYKEGGNNRKWRDFANYITLYHPHSGLYTQYVHLDYQGALIELGDWVQPGQSIAISGLTGWTSTPHLHFNVIYPKEDEFVGTPVEFIEGMAGKDLKEGMQLEKKPISKPVES